MPLLLGLLVLFWYLGDELVEGDLTSWNQRVFVQVQQAGADHPGLLHLATVITHTGDWPGYALGAVVCLLVYRRHGDGPRLRWQVILLGGAGVLIWVLKLLYFQTRPAIEHQVSGYAFPSGHTLYATCLYGYLGVVRVQRGKRDGYLLMLWPLAVAWSRVMLSRHWLSDVVGGALIGAAWATFCLHRLAAAERRGTLGSVDPGEAAW